MHIKVPLKKTMKVIAFKSIIRPINPNKMTIVTLRILLQMLAKYKMISLILILILIQIQKMR